MKSTRVWRISHQDYAGEAFSGEGARIYGGRFNSRGHTAVYVSGTLSLALLEMLVQIHDRNYLASCVCFYADLPESLIEEVLPDRLPSGWDSVPYRPVFQDFGDDWLEEQRSAVLKVPSVVVPVEHNFIINPKHPDFDLLSFSEPKVFPFDKRLFSKNG